MKKKILDPARLRRVPAQFSWVDHRLIRHRLLAGCCSRAWALYLFLVTVADAEGISYYSQESLRAHLNMGGADLAKAREELLRAALIAYEAPFYQVLDVQACLRESPRAGAADTPRSQETLAITEILQNALKGGPR